MANTVAEDDKKLPGCAHYQRKCSFVSPCCHKVYICRVCHDENEVHQIDRKAVTELECNLCSKRQKVSNKCVDCSEQFGNYFCEICRLFDDIDKGQFHCKDCGICRVGGKDNFFHCPKCDLCLAICLRDSHRCVEQASRTNCPVCLEDLHSAREQTKVPDCGHLLHDACFKDMLKNGSYACALCGESMVDMARVWETLDEEIATTPMPEEYRNIEENVLCKDCHKVSRVKFHVVGQKCAHCGSYNTCGTDKTPDILPVKASAEEDQSTDANLAVAMEDAVTDVRGDGDAR